MQYSSTATSSYKRGLCSTVRYCMTWSSEQWKQFLLGSWLFYCGRAPDSHSHSPQSSKKRILPHTNFKKNLAVTYEFRRLFGTIKMIKLPSMWLAKAWKGAAPWQLSIKLYHQAFDWHFTYCLGLLVLPVSESLELKEILAVSSLLLRQSKYYSHRGIFSFYFIHVDIGINTGGLLVVAGLAFFDMKNQDSQVSLQANEPIVIFFVLSHPRWNWKPMIL